MFLKLQCFSNWFIRFPLINFYCSETLLSESKNKGQSRNYKKFDNKLFRNDLLNEFYQKTFQPNILIRLRLQLSIYLTDMHHYKKNMLEVTTLVNKNLMKAILIKSKLLNKFRQGRTISSHAAYKKQRNIHVKLL